MAREQHSWLARVPWWTLLAALYACPQSSSSTSSIRQQQEPGPAGSGDSEQTPKPTACTPKPVVIASRQRCSLDPAGDPTLPTCLQWTKVEPDGAVCGDGSPYKFFVNYSPTSDNLLVMFEPGGACWDYGSCTGGERGAANPHGLPDDHMSKYQFLNLLRRSPDNPAADWNMVFVSYCTGDIHVGDKVAHYADPAGGPELEFHHAGLADTEKVLEYLQPLFPSVPQLLVTGCSAGGIGALQHYAAIRESLSGTQCGYLLDDSGPAFHSDGPSGPVHAKIHDAWNLDTYLARAAGQLNVPVEDISRDFGLINTALADRFPNDRLAFTAYRMDFNYSLYEYQRFYPEATAADIHALWWQDMQGLMEMYDSKPNLAYFVPYFRSDNCSHCVSIPPLDHDTITILSSPWLGSDIASQHIDLQQFVRELLDDSAPLQSYVEEPKPGVDFTPEQQNKCFMSR